MLRTVLAAALIGTGALSGTAIAEDWPTRPITLVVPFAAGGGIDVSARLQALKMGELLGQTIVVENVGGAAGMTGAVRVAKAPPDGYTFLIGNTGTQVYSQSLYKKPLFDAITDFTPVGLVSESPRILLARKDLPVNNLQELIAYAKANQSKMQFGSAGVGSGTHLPCVLLNLAIGRQHHARALSRRRPGDAGRDRRPHRLHVQHDPDRRGAGQAGHRQGHRRDGGRACRSSPTSPTTGEQGLPGVEATRLERILLSEGHARRRSCASSTRRSNQ